MLRGDSKAVSIASVLETLHPVRPTLTHTLTTAGLATPRPHRSGKLGLGDRANGIGQPQLHGTYRGRRPLQSTKLWLETEHRHATFVTERVPSDRTRVP